MTSAPGNAPRNALGADINYLSPDYLETTNRILADIKLVLDRINRSNQEFVISLFFYNKKERTFHSHLVLNEETWKAQKSQTHIDSLDAVFSKIAPIHDEYKAKCKTEAQREPENISSGNADHFERWLVRKYSHISLGDNEYLGGLLRSFLDKGAENHFQDGNRFLLLSADLTDGDLSSRFPTLWSPYYVDNNGPIRKHQYTSAKQLQDSDLHDPRIIVFDKLSTLFYMSAISARFKKLNSGAKNPGFSAIVIPLHDTWDAGIGYGGLWGVLVCSFLSKDERDAYINKPRPRSLNELLTEIERISDAYFAAGLVKLTNEAIKPPYDLISLFVDRLHWIQDWERVTVLDGHKQKLFCYRHVRATCRVEWEWTLCKETDEQRCSSCRNGAKDRVFKWKEHIKNPDGGDQHPILNKHLLKDLNDAEFSAYGDIDIEFEFPRSAVVPRDEIVLRHFWFAIARQHIAALRALLPVVRARRALVRNAVSAIMGRNMSHNIGSHVLARYASKAKEDIDRVEDGGADHRGDFLGYLQRRMDFLAEMATSDQAFWSQPLSLKEQIARLNYGEQKKRIAGTDECIHDKQCTHHLSPNGCGWQKGSPILLSFITGKDPLLASVEYGEPQQCNASKPTPQGCSAPYLPKGQEDFWFSCPGGEVGVHALFVILENIVRNSARHSGAGNDTVRVFVRVDDNGGNEELLKVEIIDPRTKLEQNGCPQVVINGKEKPKYTDDKINAEIDELREKHDLEKADGKRRKLLRLHSEINSILRDEPFLEASGSPNPQYWGVREMQICAHYLRGYPLTELEARRTEETEKYPVLKAGVHKLPNGVSHCLKYTLYLQRAKLMAGVVGKEIVKRFKNDKAKLRCRGIKLIEFDPRHTNWENIASRTEGYSFLVAENGINIPDDQKTRAKLPVRSISCTNLEAIVKQVLKPEEGGIGWLQDLHKSWARLNQRNRRAWWGAPEGKGKPIWGLALQADTLKGDVSDFCIHKDGEEVLYRADREAFFKLSDAHHREWFDGLERNAVAAAWVDHAGKFHFGRGAINLAQAYLETPSGQSPRSWVSAEAVFSDSPHLAYLNSPPDNGWEILAAAVSRVAVIDERVQGEFKEAPRGIPFSIIWPAMGVWVPEKDKCNLDAPDFAECQSFLQKPAIRDDQYPIDFLILHLTILERLAGARNKSLGETLFELVTDTQASPTNCQRPADIVIVTGRGVPSVAKSREKDQLDSVRYLPISALLESLVTRPSKLALMRAIWSARRPNS